MHPFVLELFCCKKEQSILAHGNKREGSISVIQRPKNQTREQKIQPEMTWDQNREQEKYRNESGLLIISVPLFSSLYESALFSYFCQ